VLKQIILIFSNYIISGHSSCNFVRDLQVLRD